MTQTDTEYDGGFNGAGLFSYMHSGWYAPASDNREEPDALWSYAATRSTYADHAAYDYMSAVLLGVLSGNLRFDASLEDMSITDSVSIGIDSVYQWCRFYTGQLRVAGSRFTRNGASTPNKPDGTLRSRGGFLVLADSSVTLEFETSEWVANQAPTGAAVKIDSGVSTGSFRFRRCMFRCANTRDVSSICRLVLVC